ncbi:hypothetical protein GCM10027347_59630 [Larkinella harenae]
MIKTKRNFEKLEVGKRYRSRGGEIVAIVENRPSYFFPFYTDTNEIYTAAGYYHHDLYYGYERQPCDKDLIELLPDEPKPPLEKALEAVSGPTPAANDDGWINWRYGKCPVDPDDIVVVELGCGETVCGSAKSFLWDLRHPKERIVKYRNAVKLAFTPPDPVKPLSLRSLDWSKPSELVVIDKNPAKTLWDEYAIAIMGGVIAAVGLENPDVVVMHTLKYADAMMAAREGRE